MSKEKISFECFCDLLMDKLNCQEKEKYYIKNVLKANGCNKKAICVHEDCIFSPIVYLEDLYDRLNHESIESIADSVMDMFVNSNAALEKSDVFKNLTHSGVMENLTFRLINKAMNAQYLEDKVYREYLDLAIVYQVQVSVGNEKGQVVMTKQLAERLNYSEEELFKIALINTPNLCPAQDLSLLETIGAFMPEHNDINLPENFRVLTNMNMIYGATVLLYPGMVEKLYREYGCRYVIPSSLHEVLLVNHDVDPMIFLQMVREVNSSVVEAEDILSNSVYEITGNGLSIALAAA